MKTMKKLASLLLALAMIFALATTAFAAGTNTITVKSTVKDETYTLYKMMDLVVDNPDNPAVYSYTVAAEWNSFFTTGAGAAYVDIANDYVTWKTGKDTEDDMIAFGKAAAAFAEDFEGAELTGNDDAITFSGLDAGYYLITSTLGTEAIVETTPAKPNTTINEKNEKPTVTKEVQEGNDWVENNDAGIGDTVNYRAKITVKKGAVNYVLHDTMSTGLTFDKVTSVKIGDATVDASNYTITSTGLTDGCTFEVDFDDTYIASLAANTVITVSYSAVVNANAVIAGDGNPNTAKLSYGENNNTVQDVTNTKVWKFPVFKYTGTNRTPLAGAKFSLYKDANYQNIVNLTQVTGSNTYKVAATGITEIVTDTTGKFVIEGLDSGTYYLKETQEPAGYNKLPTHIVVEIAADGSLKQDGATTNEIGVLNNAGTELPSTGGMGTTLFYVVGGIMVAAAAVLLVTKKRMAN